MIGYVTLGTNDIGRAAAFYDALLEPMGAKRLWESETFIAWGITPKEAALCVTHPHDKNKATVGNGGMTAISAKTKEAVDALYERAISLGGTDEGPPGPRGGGFYAGYFRDLDGNKLNAYCWG